MNGDESFLGEPMPGYEPCCEAMRFALANGLVHEVHGEIVVLGKLPKGAKAGNVLTGEKYDASTFTMGSALRFCPWCRERQPIYEEAEE